MPLEKGKSEATLERNFDELRHGKTFSKTRKKFGKKKAEKQMQAIALNEQRKSSRRSTRRR